MIEGGREAYREGSDSPDGIPPLVFGALLGTRNRYSCDKRVDQDRQANDWEW